LQYASCWLLATRISLASLSSSSPAPQLESRFEVDTLISEALTFLCAARLLGRAVRAERGTRAERQSSASYRTHSLRSRVPPARAARPEAGRQPRSSPATLGLSFSSRAAERSAQPAPGRRCLSGAEGNGTRPVSGPRHILETALIDEEAPETGQELAEAAENRYDVGRILASVPCYRPSDTLALQVRWRNSSLPASLRPPRRVARPGSGGGLGAALPWPLSDELFVAPWRPIPVSPIGLAFLSSWGLKVALVELALFSPLLVAACVLPRAAVLRTP
jgi:hypothetical protein